jgi:L-alanine-DL-glutamate epimerase-like enolase superfamily enzyme
MRIIDIRERTAPISSAIANSFIDFSKMTLSLVAVVTDVVRDGKPVIGYGFNSNGRYGQGGLIRERFMPRILAADPKTHLNADESNIDPHKVWATMFTNEKPGGHGERSVAIGTIDMAVWDAAAKIAGKPLFRMLAEQAGVKADPKVFVYAAGGYYYPGKGLEGLAAEMQGYLDRGYTVVKMKIGGAPLADDCKRIEHVLKMLPAGSSRSMPTDASILQPPSPTPRRCANTISSGTRKQATRSTMKSSRHSPSIIPARWRPAKIFSPCRTRATSSATAACARTETGCNSTVR